MILYDELFPEAPMALDAPTEAPPKMDYPELLPAAPLSAWDRLALALAQFPTYQPQRYESGASAFGRGLLSGAAQGFSRGGVEDIRRREEERKLENLRRSKAAERAHELALKSYEARQEPGRRAAIVGAEEAARIKARGEKPAADMVDVPGIGPQPRSSSVAQRWLMKQAGLKDESGGGFMGQMFAQTDNEAIADAIAEGKFPPDVSQFSRYSAGPIASILTKKHGFDLFKAQTDYKAFQRHWATLNTGVQKRLQQSIQNAYGTAGVLDELNAKLSTLAPRFRQTPLNRLAQIAQAEGLGSDEAAATVTQLRGLAETLRFELANVYMGGGVPTDQAQRKAANIIDPSVSPARLTAQIALARRELNIRQQAINSAGPVSPSNPATVEPQGSTTVGPRVMQSEGADVQVVIDPKTGKLKVRR